MITTSIETAQTAVREGHGTRLIFPTQNPKINSCITLKPLPDGGCQLTGHLVDASTGKKIPGINNKHLKAISPNRIELDIRSLCGMLLTAYEELNEHNRAVRAKTVTRGKDQHFSSVLSECLTLAGASILPGLADSTKRKYITYFLRSIAPRMDHYGPDITNEDLETIKTELTQRAFSSGRTKSCRDGTVNRKDYAIAQQTVSGQMVATQKIYDYIRENYSEYALPPLDFPVERRQKLARPEQLRSFTDEVFFKIAAILRRLIRERKVFLGNGAYLMMRNGLRTAEAIAPLIGELIRFDDLPFGMYYVCHQVDSTRQRIPHLKREASYRPAPLTADTLALLREYIQHLEQLGYSLEQIMTMPFMPDMQDPTQHISPSTLSEFLKKVFTAAGVTSDYLKNLQIEMHSCPEYDANGALIIEDPTAYAARRNFASYSGNICGVSEEDLHILIGHEERLGLRNAMFSRDRMVEMARALEYCVLDPETAVRPTLRSLLSSDAVELQLIGPNLYKLVAKKDIDLGYDITAREPADPIMIACSGQLGQPQWRSVPDTPEKRTGRQVMGQWPDEATLRKWIAEVEAINLEEFDKYRQGGDQ